MANTILHKRSSTASATPAANQLSAGELALNTADSKVFLKNSAGTVVEVSYRDARVDSRMSTVLAAVTYSILPATDITYDLGSPSKQWRDIYVGPGSLYVNGQKVLEEDGGDIVISCDINQNLVLSTTGTGDIELLPAGSGVVAVKGPMQITAGKNISSSDGNAISFSNSIAVDSLSSKTANTDLTLTGAGTGKVYINDNLETTGNIVVGGNLTVSGTTTTVNSETISLADNLIDLNSNFTTGSPSEDAGIRVMRGDSNAVQIRWTEANDVWQFTNDGTNYLSFASLTGTETLTNKTIAAGSNTITGLTNTNLSGTAAISNANLANSSVTVGSTAIALGASATTIAGLTSVTSTTFVGALTGNATTSSSTSGNAASVTNGVYTTDTGTVTNTMLAGSIANAKLVNSSTTVGTTAIALGASSTTLAGLTSVTSTTFVGALTGNASTATTAAALTTARTINGVSFDGSANITVTATNALTIGTGLSGSSYNGSGAVTVAIDSTVATLTGSQTLTNKTLTAPSISALAITDSSIVFEGATADAHETTLTVVDPTADRVITFPDATTTVVGTDATQTLTNKTINGSNNTITNVSLTSGVTGTLPVANGGSGSASSTGTGSNVLSADPTFTGTVNVAALSSSGNITVGGDLTVNGTTTTVNSTTVTVDDKNLELGSVASPTDVTANGGGVTLKGATDKTWNWLSATSAWTSSEHIALAAGKNIYVSGSSSGTTTIAALANAGGTVYLPASTDTLVGRATTDTLTNKSISGATNTLSAIANASLTNSSVTVTAGTGMSGGGAVSLGGTVTLTNAGVTSNVAGTGISVSGATGAVTVTNTGVTSNVAGTGVTVSGATGAVTVSIGQAVATSSNVQFNAFGVGTAAGATAGSIRATNEITAYYSDKRLKENIKPIGDALNKVLQLHGVTYNANAVAGSLGYTDTTEQVGLLAQDVQAVLPQVVVPAPFDITVKDGKEVSKSGEDYLTVKYEKIVALLVEAIKELNDKVESLESQLDGSKSL